MAGTYQSSHKKYYWKNKEKITERNRDYKKEYNRLYYQANREALDKKRLENRKKERLRKKEHKNQLLMNETVRNVQASLKNA